MIFCAVMFAVLFVSCKQEQATQFLSVTDKHNIANDTNWVEVTDIDTVKVCISDKLYKNGISVNSELEYKNLFEETLKDENYLWFVRNHPDKTICTEEYQIPPINFTDRILILYRSPFGGGQPVFKRKIFKHQITSEILFLLETTYFSETLENSFFNDNITIPRFSHSSQIKFDTILRFNY